MLDTPRFRRRETPHIFGHLVTGLWILSKKHFSAYAEGCGSGGVFVRNLRIARHDARIEFIPSLLV